EVIAYSRKFFAACFAVIFFFIEPLQPVFHDVEPCFVQGVNATSAVPFLSEKAGILEDANVARRRGPRVREASGDRARRHRSSPHLHGEEDLTARRMRERREDGLEIREI